VSLIGLDVGLTAVGFALLYGLGLIRTAKDALRYCGLALMSGWALLGIATSLMLIAGAAATALEIALLAGGLVVASVIAGRYVRAQAGSRVWRSSWAASAVAVGGAALLATTLAEMLVRLRLTEPGKWDAWAFWVPKAEALVYSSGLHTGAGTIESFANPDYPPLVPTLDATVFRFAGRVDPGLLPTQDGLLAIAFFAALTGLLWRRVAPAVLLPGLVALSLLPVYQSDVGSLLGDEVLLMAFALSGVSAALWLLERDGRWLALYALFGSALALAKNEGFTYVIALGALILVLSLRHRPRWPLLLLAVPVLAMVPWKLWSDVNDVPPSDYYRFSSLLHPDYLADRANRLWTTLDQLPAYYTAFDRWLVTLPVAAVLLAVLVRSQPRLVAFVAATVTVGFLGNAVVYWISPAPLNWYISTSAQRTATGPLIFIAALLPLLAAEALRGADVLETNGPSLSTVAPTQASPG
jgi:hypothetical protein